MKVQLGILLILSFFNTLPASFAEAEKATKTKLEEPKSCYEEVYKSQKEEAEKSDTWGFEDLLYFDGDLEKTIREARWDSSTEEERKNAKEEAQKANRELFVLVWNAPSNTGTSLLVVDSQNCKVVLDLILESEE